MKYNIRKYILSGITVILALAGIIITGILVVKNIKGNILWGILITIQRKQ